MARTNDRGRLSKNESKWIRKDKRLAIYARDGYHCLWCGCAVVAKDNATLDHFLPASRGGCNLSTNVFTSCFTCNSSRGDASAIQFAGFLAWSHATSVYGACYSSEMQDYANEARAEILERILRSIDNPVEKRLRR